MRVMLDTNVLLSALLFPSERMNGMMRCIFEEHRLVLSSFVIEELSLVIERKFPTKALAVDQLLSAMSYELVYTPQMREDALRSETKRITRCCTQLFKRMWISCLQETKILRTSMSSGRRY